MTSPERANRYRKKLRGELMMPGNGAYEKARQLWNGMVDRRPAYIARCASVEDVVESLNFARENQLQIAVRGGGHSVAGLAMVDDGLVIDVSPMKDVQIDLGAGTVWAGAGLTIGELDAATQEYALAVPMGVVSATGIAGLTLGGGYGWLRNKYGLSCDNMIAAQVVTADGRVVIANQHENQDLLWGLRGGGGNFGIVTRFQYKIYPVGREVFFTFVLHDGERMAEALRFYKDYSQHMPDDVSMLASAGICPPGSEMFPRELHGRHFIAFVGMYAGSPQDGERVMQPLRSFMPPMVDFSDVMPYVQAQQAYDEDYPNGMRYYWKSLSLLELPDEAIEIFVKHARQQPSVFSTTDLWDVGGAVKRFSADHGAYFGRHTVFLVNPEANWHTAEDDQANIQWARDFIEALRPFSDGSRYMNFAGFQEEGDRMMREAFGANYTRLAALKAKYDPHNLFRLNQNIKPAGER